MDTYSIIELIFGVILIGYGIYYGFLMNSENAIVKNRKYRDSYAFASNPEERSEILKKYKSSQKLTGIILVILGFLFIIRQFLF
jgi:hypothetical protein